MTGSVILWSLDEQIRQAGRIHLNGDMAKIGCFDGLEDIVFYALGKANGPTVCAISEGFRDRWRIVCRAIARSVLGRDFTSLVLRGGRRRSSKSEARSQE